jgi:uncharacterized protein (DUF2235 family)
MKNIVVCCDGTGNQVVTDETNVLKLWGALSNDRAAQVSYYAPGVGTLGDLRVISRWRRRLRRSLDSAIGYSVRESFIAIYRFLSATYTPGDNIYFFGFSRGAYTARAVAGAMHAFGLLAPEHVDLAHHVWRSYSNDDGDENAQKVFDGATRFKRRFARVVPITFMGLWDTVSSYGALTNLRTLPYTRVNPSVKVVRHAVALDERRAFFRANHVGRHVPERKEPVQDVKEVWFCGAHADVGGGYPAEESGLAQVAFRWMLGEASAHGMMLDKAAVKCALSTPVADVTAPVHKSLRSWWRVLEMLPQRRWNHALGRHAWRLPNFGRLRVLRGLPGEGCILVHDSVRQRQAEGAPVRNLPNNVMWVADAPLNGENTRQESASP